MKAVVFHPEAAEEARAIAAYYEGIRSGLGADFRAELSAAVTSSCDNPLLYAAEAGSIRLCPLRRFPFSIYYQDLPERIWIAAVGHHRRRPGYWSRRLSS